MTTKKRKPDTTLDRARSAKGTAADIFGRLLDVVAVGITRVDGRYALKVNVCRPPPAKLKLPPTIRGVPVRVEVVGRLRKRLPADVRRSCNAPLSSRG
jgi:hypothetical protein